MKQDPMALIDGLKKTQSKLIEIIDDLQDIAAQSNIFAGKIQQVLPVNIQNTIEKINEVVNGSNQESIGSLLNFLSEIPLGDLERPSAKAGMTNTVKPQAPVDTTPHVNADTQSAILANESTDLNNFLKVQYPHKFKESLSPFSVDAIADSNDGSWSVGQYDDDLDDIVNNTNIPEEDEMDSDYAGIYVPKMIDPTGNIDEDMPLDAGDVIIPEGDSDLGWQDVLHNAHPYDDESIFHKATEEDYI